MTETKNELQSFKPFKNELLIQRLDPNETSGGIIATPFSNDSNDGQYYYVIKKGKNVTEVEEGQVVFLNWSNATLPFFLSTDNGEERFTITKEENIEFVIDEE